MLTLKNDNLNTVKSSGRTKILLQQNLKELYVMHYHIIQSNSVHGIYLIHILSKWREEL